jgi:hypothetical protein
VAGAPLPAAQTVRMTGGDDGLAELNDADFIGAEAGRTALRLAAAREAAEAEAQAPAAPAVDEAPAAAPVAPFRPARRRPDPFRARLLGGTSLCAGVEPRDKRAVGRRPLGP